MYRESEREIIHICLRMRRLAPPAAKMAPPWSPTQRHINGVVSHGVVPKSQICKMVAKPAPDIIRIQGVYHNEAQFHSRIQGGDPGALDPGEYAEPYGSGEFLESYYVAV